MTLLTVVGWIEHEAETGGGPTGFGWASFLALLAGVGAISYMLGNYLVARYEAKKRATDGTIGADWGSSRRDFDPYDDLARY